MTAVVKSILKDVALLLVAGTVVAGSGLGPVSPPPAHAAAAATAPIASEQKLSEAAQVVENFHATLLDASRNSGAENYQTRYQAIQPAVRNTFDIAYISQTVLGPYWGKLSPQQRDLFIERFAKNTIATYAAQFSGYSGEEFKHVGTQQPQKDLRVVRSDLVTGEGQTHHFAYLMRETDEGWRVVNVLVDNVSQMAVQRSEYTSILRDGGFDKLIALLDSQASRMKQTS